MSLEERLKKLEAMLAQGRSPWTLVYAAESMKAFVMHEDGTFEDITASEARRLIDREDPERVISVPTEKGLELTRRILRGEGTE